MFQHNAIQRLIYPDSDYDIKIALLEWNLSIRSIRAIIVKVDYMTVGLLGTLVLYLEGCYIYVKLAQHANIYRDKPFTSNCIINAWFCSPCYFFYLSIDKHRSVSIVLDRKVWNARFCMFVTVLNRAITRVHLHLIK